MFSARNDHDDNGGDDCRTHSLTTELLFNSPLIYLSALLGGVINRQPRRLPPQQREEDERDRHK